MQATVNHWAGTLDDDDYSSCVLFSFLCPEDVGEKDAVETGNLQDALKHLFVGDRWGSYSLFSFVFIRSGSELHF